MNSLKKRIKYLIYLESFTSSDVLYNSIRVAYIISIMFSDAILPTLKTIMLLSVFLTEIPSGYIANKFGNKVVVLLAKLLNFLAILLFLVAKDITYFVVIYILMGLGSSLESGSKNVFMLNVCYSYEIDYKQIKVDVLQKITIYKIIMSVLGSYLFFVNELLPFIFTALMYFISFLTIAYMPKVNVNQQRETKKVGSLKDCFRIIAGISANKKILYSLFSYTIVSTSLIFIFDYYQVYFETIGIPVEYFGIIYAVFKLFNYLGGTLFKWNFPRYLSLVMIGLTFIMFIFVSPQSIFIAIAI